MTDFLSKKKVKDFLRCKQEQCQSLISACYASPAVFEKFAWDLLETKIKSGEFNAEIEIEPWRCFECKAETFTPVTDKWEADYQNIHCCPGCWAKEKEERMCENAE